jgi:hypothetical protein
MPVGGGGALAVDGAGVTVVATVAVVGVGVAFGFAGCLRGFSAGVGTACASAATDAWGAWIEIGEASDVATGGLELDLVAIPSASAATNATTATAIGSRAGLCESALLNLDIP